MTETKLALLNRYNITEGFGLLNDYVSELKFISSEISSTYKERLNTLKMVKESELLGMREDFNRKKAIWSESVKAINRRGSRDWTKALKRYQRDKEEWLDNYKNTYEEQSSLWNQNYAGFLNKKAEWVEDLAVKTSVAGNSFIMGDITASAEKAISEAARESVVKWQEKKSGADDNYISSLISEDFFRMTESLRTSNSLITNVNTTAHGMLKTSSLGELNIMELIQNYSTEDKEELKKELLLITAFKAEEQIESAKEALVERVNKANSGTRSSLTNRFQNYGYDYNASENLYTLSIITDATSFGGIERTTARIQGFREFDVPKEVVNYKSQLSELNLSEKGSSMDGMSSRYIETLINGAMKDIKSLREDIFGPDITDIHEKADTTTLTGTDVVWEDKEVEILGFIPTTKKVRVSRSVTKEIKTIKGSFHNYVGYAPVLISAVDPLKAKSASEFRSQIQFQGSGEMGRIMTDFYRYSMLEQRGWGEMSKDWTQRRIVNDDNAPDILKGWTVRRVMDTGISIIGAATLGPFGAAAFSLIDDAFFAATDVAKGADLGEEAFNLGKKAAVGFVMAGVADMGLTSSVSRALGGGFLGNTAGELTTAYVNNQMNSLSAAFTYDSENGFGFSKDTYFQSAWGEDALAGYASTIAGNATSSLLTGGLSGFSSTHASQVQTVASLGGDLARAGTEFAMTGETSVNLLNLSDFGVTHAQTGESVSRGLLEWRISKDSWPFNGKEFSFENFNIGYGSGGIGLNAGRMIDVANSSGTWWTQQRIRYYDATNQADIAEGYNGHNKAGTALRTQYSFGGNSEKAQLESILKGSTKLRVGYINNAGKSELTNGSKIVNLATLGNKGDLNSQLRAGVILSHESFRDGIIGSATEQNLETERAVWGHTNFAMNMASQYGMGFIMQDQNLTNDV